MAATSTGTPDVVESPDLEDDDDEILCELNSPSVSARCTHNTDEEHSTHHSCTENDQSHPFREDAGRPSEETHPSSTETSLLRSDGGTSSDGGTEGTSSDAETSSEPETGSTGADVRAIYSAFAQSLYRTLVPPMSASSP